MNTVQRLLRVSQRIQVEVLKRNVYSHNPKVLHVLSSHNGFIPNIQTRPISFVHHDTMSKILAAIPFLGFNKTKIKAIAYKQFETSVDNTDYIGFIEDLDLPDTFYSWFAITELHLWMLSVRAMAEGEAGRLIRNTLVETLWIDVLQRVKKLNSKGNPIDIRSKIVELSEQLQASYIAYDEGLYADDVILAGALWRRFYQQEDVDVEHIEKLVQYVRKNIRALEALTTEQFYNHKNIKWCSLDT